MNTISTIFEAFKAAQNSQPSRTKTFVKEFKEQTGISLSARTIVENGFSFNQVYNKPEEFTKYLNHCGYNEEGTQSTPAPMPAPSPKVETNEAKQPEQPTQPQPAKTESKVNANDQAGKLIELIAQIGSSVSEEKVVQIIEERLKGFTGSERVVYVDRKTENRTELKGKQHKEFNNLLTALECGLNVWLNGPAGSGKSHAASQCAKALNLPFYSKSISSQTSEFSLLGFINAQGQFIETDFYKAYTTGGVFCLDEIDNGNTNVLAVLNSALSNGHCSFANGQHEKHPDFLMVATANTIGTGGNAQYVGKLQIGKEVIDRFVMIDWSYDNEIERAMTNNSETTETVIKVREAALKAGLNCVISPRASVQVAKLVNKGMSKKQAFEIAILNKLTANELTALNHVISGI